MSKFKVGDKVKIVKVSNVDKENGFEVGNVFVVDATYPVGVHNYVGNYFWDKQLELMKPKPHLVCNIGHAPKVPEWATEYRPIFKNKETCPFESIECMGDWIWDKPEDLGEYAILFVEFH